MSLTIKSISIFALCFALGACAFKKEDSENQQRQDLAEDVTKKLQEEQKSAAVDLKESNVHITFEPAEPGYYFLVIKWPEAVGSMEISLNRVLLATVAGKNYYKQFVKNGDKILVSLRAYASPANGGRFLSPFETELSVPKDLIVGEEISLTSHSTYDVERVFFYKSGKIITKGFNLSITTKLLSIAEEPGQYGNPEDKSHIVTFDKSDKTAHQFNSNIQITAEKAEGKLAVALVGLNGKDGRDAKDFTRSIPPVADSGANGTAGQTHSERSRHCGPDGSGCMDIEYCAQEPTDGQNGKNGASGINGEDGQKGGATGNLSIQVKDSQDFSVLVFQRPGLGGKGGQGTPGQKGGAGGLAGAGAPSCRPAKNGQPGANGQDGSRGKDGACGEFGEVISNVKLTIPEKEHNSACSFSL